MNCFLKGFLSIFTLLGRGLNPRPILRSSLSYHKEQIHHPFNGENNSSTICGRRIIPFKVYSLSPCGRGIKVQDPAKGGGEGVWGGWGPYPLTLSTFEPSNFLTFKPSNFFTKFTIYGELRTIYAEFRSTTWSQESYQRFELVDIENRFTSQVAVYIAFNGSAQPEPGLEKLESLMDTA